MNRQLEIVAFTCFPLKESLDDINLASDIILEREIYRYKQAGKCGGKSVITYLIGDLGTILTFLS